MGPVDELADARDAYERREWVAAYAALSDADPSTLTADDFTRLATTAFLLGRRNDAVQALQRAYQAHLDVGAPLAAARCGSELAMVLVAGGEMAVGSGWIGRCQRLLEDVSDDVVERGHVLMPVMLRHVFSDEYEEAFSTAVTVIDYGRRFADDELVANGLNAQGRMLLYSGQVREGLALLDEAMAGLATGHVSPILAGEVYCSLIEACQEVSDYGRAAEWTAALSTWIDTQPGLVMFTGQRAVHRGQILRMRGAFPEAVQELEGAMERYVVADTPAPAGMAMDECGGIHRMLGDLDAAETCFEKSIDFGHEPQPGLALLWLARGRDAAAAGAVRRLLAEPRDPVHRSQLLPGAVEVLLAVDDVGAAADVAGELLGLAEQFGSAALLAMALYAQGSALLAGGDDAAAVLELRRALRVWQSVMAPYEIARCRVLIGRALRHLGDVDSASGELAAARRTFRELGATPAEQEVARLLSPAHPAGLTDREVEVLRLVATGRSNPEIAAALVLSDKTVARHLSNIFAKLGVTSRTAAAAFAFEHRML